MNNKNIEANLKANAMQVLEECIETLEKEKDILIKAPQGEVKAATKKLIETVEKEQAKYAESFQALKNICSRIKI